MSSKAQMAEGGEREGVLLSCAFRGLGEPGWRKHMHCRDGDTLKAT